MSRDPKSYRFQIREHFREERDGNSWNTYGPILWTEDETAPETVPLVWRVSTLTETADELAEEHGRSVAAGIVSVSGADVFEAQYFTSPKPRLSLVGQS